MFVLVDSTDVWMMAKPHSESVCVSIRWAVWLGVWAKPEPNECVADDTPTHSRSKTKAGQEEAQEREEDEGWRTYVACQRPFV